MRVGADADRREVAARGSSRAAASSPRARWRGSGRRCRRGRRRSRLPAARPSPAMREVARVLVALVLADSSGSVLERVELGVQRVDTLELQQLRRRRGAATRPACRARAASRKMPSAGGQVPTQTVAPASASALAMANPKPPSSATPATSARLPVRSMASMSRKMAARDDASQCAPVEFQVDGLARGRAGVDALSGTESHWAGQWLRNRLGGRQNLDAIAFLKVLKMVNEAVHAEQLGCFTVAEVRESADATRAFVHASREEADLHGDGAGAVDGHGTTR